MSRAVTSCGEALIAHYAIAALKTPPPTRQDINKKLPTRLRRSAFGGMDCSRFTLAHPSSLGMVDYHWRKR